MSNRERYKTFIGDVAIGDIQQQQLLDERINLDADFHYRLPAMVVTLSPVVNDDLSCGVAPQIPNAVVYNTSFSHNAQPGDVVEYKCDEGFALLENKFIICQPDGIWSETPYCAELPGFPHCDKPPRIPNAYIAYQSFENGQWPETGAVVTYRCEKGFRMKNDNYIRCSGFMWSGQMPVCIPRSNCGPVPNVNENTEVAEVSVSDEGVGKPGDFIKYRCSRFVN